MARIRGCATRRPHGGGANAYGSHYVREAAGANVGRCYVVRVRGARMVGDFNGKSSDPGWPGTRRMRVAII